MFFIEKITNKEVNNAIKKHKVEHREFFTNEKIIYALKDKDNRVVGMIGVSQNKQLIGSVKLYNPFVLDNNLKYGKMLIKLVVKNIIKNGDIVFCDVKTEAKPYFESAGFKFTSVKENLKLYDKLWRGIYYR